MSRRNRSAPPAHSAPPFHDPWVPHDFPNTTALICRGCSYSPEGRPLTPVPFPCPAVAVTPPEIPDQPNPDQPNPMDRLARAARNRRIVLGLSQRQVAERGPIAKRTVVSVENGHQERLQDRTITALERALEWDTGSVQRVLDGGKPVVLSTPPIGGTPEVTVVLEAGLPAKAETLLVAHMSARRADMEAVLEGEARMLIEQVRAATRAARRVENAHL
ncbi:helix-turn-helix domain-containing protein [Micromonospora sp. MED01]|uniref:helix-turn-helix domain-containing protein n=1 Tax=Micromonospora alfalfae TaxID=2911212 RepID=UPI001EE9966B|nr:helix-turn-helix transcriptional regulator [Micromonospora alfalfae]MCG5464308.1 helix-turn-helix domain-containing protein [Micromonospora alfalfae]